ncbi:Leucine-rich repeat (LRR) protein [Fontibacillus panacisegetis]|uniref:Leucine-rich repeat (LRR) protein n=1 Tax=Fontibacillus panacisegetis TaxID=670482 RepID=A0A1G7UPE1_9BACL|nr:stalk domain-containing protein [Fontibacillus panacisegetis]SDG49432.1 Leucine-rich repeat (LRR) protein [Fontibacillus panacisegetis]
MRKIIGSTLILIIVLLQLLTLPITTASAKSNAITFPDPVFEMIIRHYINKPTGSITQSDVDQIKSINTNEVHSMLADRLKSTQQDASEPPNGILSLEGIRYLHNLESLHIELKHDPVIRHTIKDLTELKNLKKLKKLTLIGVSLESIQGVEGLTQLTDLNLSYNVIADLEPLKPLTKLEHLDLSWNQLSQGRGLAPLKGMSKLKNLNLEMNAVDNITPLSSLTNLQELILGGSGNGDLSPLQKLTKLQKLNINYFNAKNISALQNLTQLQELSLLHNQITDLSPLSNMNKLQVLNLSENQVSSLQPIEKLTSLRIINANNNQIKSLAPLKEMVHLKKIEASDNQIVSIEELRGLKNLQDVNLVRNVIDFRNGTPSSLALAALQGQGSKVFYDEFKPFPDIFLMLNKKTAYAYGEYITLPAAPIEKKGRTLVPLRVVSELMGAKVTWNGVDQSITIEFEENKIQMTVGSTKLTVNGQSSEMDTAPVIYGGTTYVPIRYIVAQSGMSVQPDGYGIILTKQIVNKH